MIDCFPRLNTMKRGRELTSALVLLVFLLLGLPLLTQGGIYVFELFNMYGVSGITLLWLTVFESIGIGWVYGADRFFDNVRSMIGYYPLTYFKICYKYLTPAISTFIFVFYCAKYKPLVVDGYVFPGWANAVGWLMSVASMLCVPVFFFHYLAVNGWKIRGADDRKQKFGQNGKKQKGAETHPLTSKEDIVVSVGLDTITKA